MIITDKQKNELKELLNEHDYEALMATVEADDIHEFEMLLGWYSDRETDEAYEFTPIGEKLDKLYFEIYNQN